MTSGRQASTLYEDAVAVQVLLLILMVILPKNTSMCVSFMPTLCATLLQMSYYQVIKILVANAFFTYSSAFAAMHILPLVMPFNLIVMFTCGFNREHK